MYQQGIYTLAENRPIAHDVYSMRLVGDTGFLTRPGQFVNILIEGFYLRRPISVCHWDAASMTLIYKVVGKGTAAMARMAPGETLDLLTGLGNGYDTALCPDRTLLIGGGVGVPPLYGLAKALRAQGKHPAALLGFARERDVFYVEAFEALGVPVTLTTEDGSRGLQGYVTAALPAIAHDFYCTCGPAPMLKSVWQAEKQAGIAGLLSFEERMGCGFGACMGCSCETIAGTKRICVDGPVMASNEVKL